MSPASSEAQGKGPSLEKVLFDRKKKGGGGRDLSRLSPCNSAQLSHGREGGFLESRWKSSLSLLSVAVE